MYNPDSLSLVAILDLNNDGIFDDDTISNKGFVLNKTLSKSLISSPKISGIVYEIGENQSYGGEQYFTFENK